MTAKQTVKIEVKGIVQGVGFRPFIYHLAEQFNLKGWVLNSSKGVEIEVSGQSDAIGAFVEQVRHNPPPLARIDSLVTKPGGFKDFQQFEIRESTANAGEFIPISADICVCKDCLNELNDPNDRRYRYPFINCTNCGPRFTIIKDIPYDRPFTTMAQFEMCADCRREYHDPLNRRFHAQPTACPVCGPQISLKVQGKRIAVMEEALQAARACLQNGEILAVKGLGGYHLACDAANHQAVARLRSRKKRSDKPFALMAFSVAQAVHYCQISDIEKALLESAERPIVLLEKRSSNRLAPDIAPGQNTLGIMLPYTPLHYLLMEPASGFPDLLVMTSGNMSDEPIAYLDSDAQERLAPIADAILIHDRPIHMRVDDSVTRVVHSRTAILRRSRGYAPKSIPFAFPAHQILAAGAELKNTFCLTRENLAFLSHHIGDLENLETLTSFEEGVAHYEKLFRIRPEIIACDLHPDYLATRYATARAEREKLPLLIVQHHHAHLAACLAENGFDTQETAIGLCFDGTGLGTDQAIWGGEILVGSIATYRRRFHLKYVPLPGGDISVRIPARMALAHLWASQIDWEMTFPPSAELCMEEKTALQIQLEKRINSPLTSSMGRLFDAAASLIGVSQRVNYEGQAAIEMEALVDPAVTDFYPFEIGADTFDPVPLWNGLIEDLHANLPISTLAARFHNSIVQLCLALCLKVKAETGISTAALSGGVWQNKVLFTGTLSLLQKHGFTVVWHSKIPANDGGIAFGQACVAANALSLKERLR